MTVTIILGHNLVQNVNEVIFSADTQIKIKKIAQFRAKIISGAGLWGEIMILGIIKRRRGHERVPWGFLPLSCLKGENNYLAILQFFGPLLL